MENPIHAIVYAAESEAVADISQSVRAKHKIARAENTSTDATYDPYKRQFKNYCESTLLVSSAVSGNKLLQFLQHMKDKKTPAKKGNPKGGSHVAAEDCERREYALKTLKGAASAIVDLWAEQEGVSVEFDGVLFARGAEHPRTASVKKILSTHRVCNIIL